MYHRTFMVFLIANAALSNGASKYYESENRPYEFGFNIEGHQHRHETKDKNGIIMGEFGFITGDGVYHVTAYATDENGNFKILFMKNIKIGLPGNQSTNALQLPKQPPTQTIATTIPPPRYVEPQTRKKPEIRPLRPGDTRTCSGCAIPKEQQDDQPLTNLRTDSLDFNKMTYTKNNLKEIVHTRRIPPNQILDSLTENKSASPKVKPYPINGPISTTNLQPQQRPQPGKLKTNSPNENQNANDKLNESPGSKNRKPIDRESLDEMRRAFVGLLYKFNYTIGFHGHHEKGDFVGSKDGGYYFVGRDGLRRDVNYVANKFGYQPYLTQEQAGDKDIPKLGTEKQAGLKGYEFKWFSERE